MMRALGDERGSITMWTSVVAVVLIVVVGAVVDLGGRAHAQQHVNSVAAQAARTGGQQIDEAAAMAGQDVRASNGQALAAAQSYLGSSDVAGTANVVGGAVLRVRTSDTYKTKFLSIIGISSLTVRGSAEARLVRALGGAEL